MVSSSVAITAAGQVAPSTLSDAAMQWLQTERAISPATLMTLPVGSGVAFFPELGREAPAIAFHYPDGIKCRAYPEKAFVSVPGSKFTFWNIENVLPTCAGQTVYLTEGELDACALVEAGIPHDRVLACPGATPKKNGKDELAGYAYALDAIEAGLHKVERVVWCGDADVAGFGLRANMARIFRTKRFAYIDWP